MIERQTVSVSSNADKLALIRKDQPLFDGETLPDQMPRLIESQEDLVRMFVTADQIWQDYFDQEKCLQPINKYLDTPPKKRTKKLKNKLKDIRRAGIIFSNAFEFADERQFLPKGYGVFLKQLGKSLDAFGKKKGKKNALRVKRVLKKNNLEEVDYIPTTVDVYKQRVRARLENVQQLALEDVLPLPEFHTMRKDLRYMMNLFQLLAIQDLKNQDLTQVFQYLDKINHDLGDVHDHYVKLKLKKEINYDKEEVEVDPELRRKIVDFCQQMLKVS